MLIPAEYGEVCDSCTDFRAIQCVAVGPAKINFCRDCLSTLTQQVNEALKTEEPVHPRFSHANRDDEGLYSPALMRSLRRKARR